MSRKRKDWAYDPPQYPRKYERYDTLSQRRESEPPSAPGSLILGLFLGLICPFVGFLGPSMFLSELGGWVPDWGLWALFVLWNAVFLFLIYVFPRPSIRIPFFGGFIFSVILREVFIISLIMAELEIYRMYHGV